MSFRHGIYTRELPTKVVPPIVSSSGLPVVIGTSPINLASEPVEANKPELIYTYEEAVKKFGYSDDWEKYTLSEFIYSQFALYGRAPVVLINVLDIEKHVKEESEELKLVDGKSKFNALGIVAESVVITGKSDESVYKINEDYILSFDKDESLNITAVNEKLNNISLKAKFNVLDPSLITSKEIIGGIDTQTGKKTGLELVSEVYPRFRIIPGSILSPGYSSNPEVAAILNAKATNINGVFSAQALIDAPTDINYTEVAEWKNKNNVVESSQFIGYPKLKLEDRVFHYSTQLAGVICSVDEKMGDIPYKSPSNEFIKANATINDKGELFLGLDQANYLNSQGIMTAINFAGWVTWGNRTAIYPISSDVKDTFIPIRRMFDWVKNSLVLTYWSKIDDPMNKRLIESVVDSANLWLNGLAAQGAIIGARVAFESEDNPVLDLMDGKIKFHFYFTPPSPAEEITFIQEYDVNYVKSLILQLSNN